jgi:hypothetical protein
MTYAFPYPASLDAFGVKVDNVSTVNASAINLTQDALAALQLKVGIDSSSDNITPSLDYLMGDFWTEQKRKLYFYMQSAPTGWSTTGLATNCVIGVKGGSGVWNVNGSIFVGQGDWGVDDMNSDSHSHIWNYYDSSTSPYHWAYESDGVTLEPYEDDTRVNVFCLATRGKVGNYTNVNKDRNYILASSLYTESDSHVHTLDGNWRPQSACGIIAKYVGA